jgi:phosphoinositide-3-kinase, regulatory subunit 4
MYQLTRSTLVCPIDVVILEGEEKHIRELLEKKRYELAQPLIPELGPKIKSIPNSHHTQTQQGRDWSPKGTLVAQFPEHRGSINSIQLAPDHKFFASCSDDGTVKIWDTDRLLTNVTNRARLTYHGHGTSAVKAISFIEGRHSIVSSSVNGKIHITRVEYLSRPPQSTKYTNCKTVNQLELTDDYATHMLHQETDFSSLLVYATKKGIISAVDIRSMKEVWSFHPPPHYGEITSLVMDKAHSWLYTGTHRGILSLWDIRFGVNTHSWQHPSKSSISQLLLYPLVPQGKPTGSSSSKTICMAVDNDVQEISVWDIETQECHQVWCVLGEEGVDSESKLNTLYGNGIKPLPAPTSMELLEAKMTKLSAYHVSQRIHRRVLAMDPSHICFVSGGSDKMIRYHDVSFPEKSFIFSGLGSNPAPVYKYSFF